MKLNRNWSKRLRSFSLRMLLLLVTLACIAMGVWRVAIRPYQLQLQAADAIEELGGKVRMVPGGSTWLARVVGQERFHEVVEVDLSNHHDASKYNRYLSSFPKLETLRVGYNFTDADMEKLKDCSELRRLYFQHTQITDAGLAVCEPFSHLRVLLLGRNITDAGLSVLKDKRALAYLDLSNTQVTDRGLEHLRNLPALHKVFLSERPITNSGLSVIRGLPKLDELYLAGCTEISDEGFQGLSDLGQLKTLEVRRTKIRSATIGLLESKLTKCRVLQDDRPYRAL